MAETNEVDPTPIDPKGLPGLRAERTTAEVVADVVAENPLQHSVDVNERKRRAEEAARERAAEDAAFFDEKEEPYDKGGEDTPVEP